MADVMEVPCAGGCGRTGPAETLNEMDDGQHQCDECLGAVVVRGSVDDLLVTADDSITQPTGNPGEAHHRGRNVA
ncbi:hypothetical protein [Streptomyces sp. NPDC057428]|uniref:hypothetical protein n=1 Tax=Streptomyces sp. NPDC057428 TaxID=3346129 RepID=UPI0036A66066